ncbi:MAG: bifunctional phosphoribosylaminoimidazolecarboxamide formyltransferase/IMP cyclohydrolase [Bacteroidetes bacterium]|nr:bifunctional phosphoribosylaminoimidazolecarboxamide formyltransferase/IMP cyclohydrolase [Bacteroidota bacterium]
MSDTRTLSAALISVFDKTGLEPIIEELHQLGVTLYSTGGTEAFIRQMGIPVVPVEDLTEYPSILGGRVKTLHPKVFGGILNRQNHSGDQAEMAAYQIPQIDLVIVNLYPFEDTVAAGGTEQEIIEKIDIGGIALIRAAAKNFHDVLCIADKKEYPDLLALLKDQKGDTLLAQRKHFSAKAFHVSSNYDTAIFNYFNADPGYLKISQSEGQTLRYGENPHQEGRFFGPLHELLEQLHGKALSYNNLLDIDAAVQLMQEFKNEMPTFAILKHNNTCGLATRPTLHEAYVDALAGDPVSAFGGILIANTTLDAATAAEIHNLFCEVVIAPGFEGDALDILKQKKNRILLKQNDVPLPQQQLRSCLNGVLVQGKDLHTDQVSDLKNVTREVPNTSEIEDLLFASKICKHTKSNTIVLVKNKQLLASGTGQTSRVDALNQAIVKAKNFNFDLQDAVMASDAFFPFPDCVSIAYEAGIRIVIQPGGSIKDQDSIDFCNKKNMKMVLTGIRHFKH